VTCSRFMTISRKDKCRAFSRLARYFFGLDNQQFNGSANPRVMILCRQHLTSTQKKA
jgi:hypothetical protein